MATKSSESDGDGSVEQLSDDQFDAYLDRYWEITSLGYQTSHEYASSLARWILAVMVTVNGAGVVALVQQEVSHSDMAVPLKLFSLGIAASIGSAMSAWISSHLVMKMYNFGDQIAARITRKIETKPAKWIIVSHTASYWGGIIFAVISWACFMFGSLSAISLVST